MKMNEKLIKVKKEIILDAAKQLFSEKGYDNTYIDEVAQAAGISKTTLYEYFTSKEEILIRVFIQAITESHDLYLKAIRKKITGYEKLHAYSLAIYNCYESNPQYLNLFDAALRTTNKISNFSSETQEIYQNSHNATEDLLRSMFKLGVKDGSLRQDLNIDLSISYFGVTIQHIVKLFILSPKFTMDDYLTSIDYFLKGICC